MQESIGSKIFRHLRTRYQIIFNNEFLTLEEKLGIISRRNFSAVAKDLIRQRHVSSGTNSESYFEINGFKIFYRPPYPIKDQQYYMNGICQVLAESFIYPELFDSHVFLNPGDSVLDLGANIGTTALIFSKKVGPEGKIYAVEPVTHPIIQQNLKANDIRNVVVIPKAVSEQAGMTEIEISDFCLDSSIAKRDYTTEKSYYSQRISVELQSIDQLVDELKLKRLDFIKMDIEGVEELALRGARDVIKKFKPRWSISSYHIDFKNELQHDKLVMILREYGYNIKESAKSHIFAW